MSLSTSTLRKHTVPTHLNLPDQVLTFWSFNLTARQLLLLLVGGGLSGDLWHMLAVLGHATIVGQVVRVLLTLVPLLLTLVVAWYQHAGLYLEVWCIVLLRYFLHPRRYVWRTLRYSVQHLSSHDPPVSHEERRAGRHAATTVVPDHITQQVTQQEVA